MVEDKIFNNNFDNVEYGTERSTQKEIAIHPLVADLYEECTSDSMDEVYTKRRIMELMDKFYLDSEFYEKYKQTPKKVDRRDFFGIYYYFKDKLNSVGEFNIVQIFCAICEFFDLNYRVMYKDIITLEDKVKILETIEEQQGIDKHLKKSKKLF